MAPHSLYIVARIVGPNSVGVSWFGNTDFLGFSIAAEMVVTSEKLFGQHTFFVFRTRLLSFFTFRATHGCFRTYYSGSTFCFTIRADDVLLFGQQIWVLFGQQNWMFVVVVKIGP